MAKTELVSAQVVLTPAAAAAPQAIMEIFRQAGFAVGHPLANNFSIAATAETFERYFDVKLEPLQGGRMKIVSAEPISDLELPNSALPLPLKDKVSAVLFTPPPDFGPGANF